MAKIKTLYKTQGTCSQYIEVAAEDGIVNAVRFMGGCDGNLQGICRLVEGHPVEHVIARLNGIRCGSKFTSCPDQLCRALEQLMSENR